MKITIFAKASRKTAFVRLGAVLLILSLLFAGCSSPTETPEKATEPLIIHYIDVGQADGMLLIAGETTVLIDAGNTDTSGAVVKYLRRFGITELDLVINTHPHGDHLGGIPAVLQNFTAKEVWCSHAGFTTTLFSYFKDAVHKQGLEIQCPAPGTTYASDGLTIEVLGPLHSVSDYEDLNDTSLVLMIKYGERKFLFTGDMEAYAEKQLVGADIDLKADVLKVGHHGSYSSTSYEFLKEVAPEYGIISCGRDNEYGHPHNGPVYRLRDAGVELYRTDLMGDIILVTDGQELAFFLSTRDTEIDGYGKYQKAA